MEAYPTIMSGNIVIVAIRVQNLHLFLLVGRMHFECLHWLIERQFWTNHYWKCHFDFSALKLRQILRLAEHLEIFRVLRHSLLD